MDVERWGLTIKWSPLKNKVTLTRKEKEIRRNTLENVKLRTD